MPGTPLNAVVRKAFETLRAYASRSDASVASVVSVFRRAASVTIAPFTRPASSRLVPDRVVLRRLEGHRQVGRREWPAREQQRPQAADQCGQLEERDLVVPVDRLRIRDLDGDIRVRVWAVADRLDDAVVELGHRLVDLEIAEVEQIDGLQP